MEAYTFASTPEANGYDSIEMDLAHMLFLHHAPVKIWQKCHGLPSTRVKLIIRNVGGSDLELRLDAYNLDAKTVARVVRCRSGQRVQLTIQQRRRILVFWRKMAT